MRDERSEQDRVIPRDKIQIDTEQCIRDSYVCMGSIDSKLTALTNTINNTNNRMFFALIGLIAAMIGVKVLGSDPFLDIVTFIGILAVLLVLGVIVAALRMVRNNGNKLTRTGIALIIMMALIGFVTGLAYFRDLGMVSVRVVYIASTFQYLAVCAFAWFLMTNARFLENKHKPPASEGTYSHRHSSDSPCQSTTCGQSKSQD